MSRRVNGVEYSEVGHEDFIVEYDLYMHRYLTLTGVLDCLEPKTVVVERVVQTPTGPITIKGEETRDGIQDLLKTLEDSPHTPKLLAGLVKTATEPWTPELARRTETEVLRCREHDKIVLFEMLITGLNTFFATRQTILNDFPSIIMKGITGRITEREPPETRGLKQYGQWDEPLRVLAGYNPDIVAKELRWHLRDFLLAYEHYVKLRAADGYRDAMKIYAVLAPYAKKGKLKPPKIPRILRGRRTHGNHQE